LNARTGEIEGRRGPRGRATMNNCLRSELPWRGAEVNEHVNRVSQNLASARGPELVFEFRVVRSPNVAFKP
jgi:hypothetical protein